MSTLKSIAESAGVSPSMVSAVLNGTHRAQHPTALARADRIREIARKLKYRPHTAAQSMRSGRFNSIAFVTDALTSRTALPRELIAGISSTLAEHKQTMAFTELPDERIGSSDYFPNLLQRSSVDGVLVNYHGVLPVGFERQLMQTELPAIWINANRGIDTIRPADHEAATRATEELLMLGHRRIAYVDRDYLRIPRELRHVSREERLNGYRAAMEVAGLPSCLYSQDPSEPKGPLDAWCHGILEGPHAPTAVICYGSEIDTLVSVAYQAGMRLPQDLSLVVFGDRPVRFGLTLATLVLPWQDIGSTAVERLLNTIETTTRDLPADRLQLCFERGDSLSPCKEAQ